MVSSCTAPSAAVASRLARSTSTTTCGLTSTRYAAISQTLQTLQCTALLPTAAPVFSRLLASILITSNTENINTESINTESINTESTGK
eukprot:3938667-Rhodomonas_salina.1